MELPKNEAVFEINEIGETTLKKYDGMFTVRCVLSMGQKHAMELEKTRLLGGHEFPTADLNGTAILLGTLRAKIIEAPEWWKQSSGGANIQDENVLLSLYNKIDEAEKAWKQKVKDLATPQKEAVPASQS